MMKGGSFKIQSCGELRKSVKTKIVLELHYIRNGFIMEI